MTTEFSKTFHHIAPEGDFSAYNAALKWLKDLGYSIGSMERGAPTMVFRGDCYVAKYRNLSPQERAEAAGKIEGTGGRFRGGPVTVTLYGDDAEAAIRREAGPGVQVIAAGAV